MTHLIDPIGPPIGEVFRDPFSQGGGSVDPLIAISPIYLKDGVVLKGTPTYVATSEVWIEVIDTGEFKAGPVGSPFVVGGGHYTGGGTTNTVTDPKTLSTLPAPTGALSKVGSVVDSEKGDGWKKQKYKVDGDVAASGNAGTSPVGATAAAGEDWSASFFIQLTSGTFAGKMENALLEFDNITFLTSKKNLVTPTSTLTRAKLSAQLTDALTDNVVPNIIVSDLVGGDLYEFWAHFPQVEEKAFVTAPADGTRIKPQTEAVPDTDINGATVVLFEIDLEADAAILPDFAILKTDDARGPNNEILIRSELASSYSFAPRSGGPKIQLSKADLLEGKTRGAVRFEDGDHKIYIGGVEKLTGSTSFTPDHSLRNDWFIGQEDSGNKQMDGVMVRFIVLDAANFTNQQTQDWTGGEG